MSDFYSPSQNNQRGSVLTAALAIVALVGVLSAASYSLLSGPVRMSATMTQMDKSKEQMRFHVKRLVSANADSNGDGVTEPPPFDFPDIDNMTGGGGLPSSLNTNLKDPWGKLYAYCAWWYYNGMMGPMPATGYIGGGALDPHAPNLPPDIVVISSGPDRVFQTQCRGSGEVAMNATGSGSSDDIIIKHNYGDPTSGSTADEVWTDGSDGLEVGAASQNVGIGKTADSAYRLDVAGTAHFGGNITVDPAKTLTASDVSLGGGTIDGTIIGGSVPAPATFINFTANGTGNIDGMVIGANDPNIGQFSDLHSITSMTIGPGAINNLNGVITLGGDNLTSTMNGVAIGPTTASTGRFTNLTWTGTMTPPNTTVVANLNVDRLDGQHDTYYTNATNLASGTVPAARLLAFTGDMTTTAGTVATSVVRLQGRAMSSAAPGADTLLGWNGSAWAPMTVSYGAGGASVIGFSGANFLATDTNIASGNCSTNQIPKYTGSYWACGVDATGVQGLPIDPENVATTTVMGQLASVNSGKNLLAYTVTDNTLLGRSSGQTYFTATPTGSYNTFLGAYSGQTVTSGSYNTFAGANAGAAITSGSYNAFIGSSAGAATQSGDNNSFAGYNAGAANTASNNLYIGRGAGALATSGTRNIFIGASSGGNGIVTGSKNIAIGAEGTAGTASTGAGAALTSGSSNIFIGQRSGAGNSTGASNVFIGSLTGLVNNADGNVFIGRQAGQDNTSGTKNVFIGLTAGGVGKAAGGSNTIGQNNTFIGTATNNYSSNASGGANTTGSDNVYVGASTFASNNGSGNVGFGFRALSTLTNMNNSIVFLKDGVYTTANSGGSHNIIAIGTSLGYTPTFAGSYNIVWGYSAGGGMTTGSSNVLLGGATGAYASPIGNQNTFVGLYAGNGTGSRNLVVAASTGCCGYGSPGDENTTIGVGNSSQSAGSSYNVSIGNSSGPYTPNSGSPATVGNTYVGASASRFQTGSNNVSIGASSNTSGTATIAFGFSSTGSGSTGSIAIGSSASAGNAAGTGNIGIGNSVTNTAVANTFTIYRSVATAGNVMTGVMNSGNMSVQGAAWTYLSDSRLKKDVATIRGALAGLLKLRGVTFKWNGISNKDIKSTAYGVIAQDVLKVFPHLVTKIKVKGHEYLQVAYDYFTPLLIEAMKEQDDHFRQQQHKIAARQKILDKQHEQLVALQSQINQFAQQKF